MAKTESLMAELGTSAPGFTLKDTEGKTVSLEDFTKPLVIMFICNHCPFVKHIAPTLAKITANYESEIDFVAINSNDTEKYPEDSLEAMIEEKVDRGYTFPYLLDETQEVAKAYGATCTPDFFFYSKQRKLIYRGQFDDSRPGNNKPVTGGDLRAAIEAVIEGQPTPANQVPSLGCNIKWKPGNNPKYYQP